MMMLTATLLAVVYYGLAEPVKPSKALAPGQSYMLHPKTGKYVVVDEGMTDDPYEYVDEFIRLIDERISVAPKHFVVCQFGLPVLQEILSWAIFERFDKAKFENLYMHFLNTPAEDEAYQKLKARYGKAVSQWDEVTEEGFDSYCNLIVMTLDNPLFTWDQVRILASKRHDVMLSYMKYNCGSNENRVACTHHARQWDTVFGPTESDLNFCSDSQCLGMIDSSQIYDDTVATNPMLTCEQLMDPETRPPSWTTQWQQDWFIYHNFFSESDMRNGTFVDVGAYHPLKYSNTYFFEKCLGWRGTCVEPSPYAHHLFRSYRKCTLLPNCAWNESKTIRMAYQKDLIEAKIVTEAADEEVDETRGGFFEATCMTLEEILDSQGYHRVDFLSVDVEHAEVQLFEKFPFHKFDIRTIVIELQVASFYLIDAIMTRNGYGKVAILGGDHVYVKIGDADTMLNFPNGAAMEHAISGENFHDFKKPHLNYD